MKFAVLSPERNMGGMLLGIAIKWHHHMCARTRGAIQLHYIKTITKMNET